MLTRQEPCWLDATRAGRTWGTQMRFAVVGMTRGMLEGRLTSKCGTSPTCKLILGEAEFALRHACRRVHSVGVDFEGIGE